MTADEERAAIVANWRAAYREANGFEATSNITYMNGWFVMDHPSRVSRYRKATLIEMTERLRKRVERNSHEGQ